MAASSLLQFGHYTTGFKGRLKDLAGLTEAADKGIAMHGGIPPPPLTTSSSKPCHLTRTVELPNQAFCRHIPVYRGSRSADSKRIFKIT